MNFYKVSTNRTITTNSIAINGDSLTITIVDENSANAQKPLTFTGTFSLNDLIAKHSQDHGCIAIFPNTFNPDAFLIAIETTKQSIQNKVEIDLTLNTTSTLEGKQSAGSPNSVIANKGSYAYFYILTPYKDCSKDDLIFVYRDTDNIELNIDEQQPNATSINSMKYFLDSWLPNTINGPDTITAGVKQVYSITAPEKTTVYLSSDIGIINRNRVSNGNNFILDTDGLNAGEIITIKTGYKYWSGVSTKTITLV